MAITTLNNNDAAFSEDDVVGKWSGKAPDGTTVCYVFHQDGSVQNVVENGEFRLWFGPFGVKASYILKPQRPRFRFFRRKEHLWEMDIFDYKDFRLHSITFQAILQPIDKRKFKMRGEPSNHAPRPGKFDSQTIVFEKREGFNLDPDTARPPRQSPFTIGRSYRVRRDFQAVRNRFRAGEVLKFEGDAYGAESQTAAYFFSTPDAKPLRAWDVKDSEDLEKWLEIFEQVTQG
jgi:hypothetical protein